MSKVQPQVGLMCAETQFSINPRGKYLLQPGYCRGCGGARDTIDNPYHKFYSLYKFKMSVWSQGSCECVLVTDIQGRSQNLRHFYPGMGLKLGVFGFSRNQNNHDLSGAYVLRFERENKHAWNAAWHAKIMDAFCLLVLFLRLWSAKTRIPQLEPHGWWCHCTGRYMSSRISLVYLLCRYNLLRMCIYMYTLGHQL